MAHHQFSDVALPDLGPATGLAVLGFRACAFGRQDCTCIMSCYHNALGCDADQTMGHVLQFTRLMGNAGFRKIGLSAPGCGRMTRDEVSIACAFSAAQAWDEVALEAHLSWLVAGPVPGHLTQTVIEIADIFAGHGLAFRAPPQGEARPEGAKPVLRVIGNA
ncbi:MAG: hypothetical protein AAGH41_08790 [Pseudomonadota bacterium]